MRLYLINPRNPLISMVNTRANRLNRYSVWKPLGLLVLAGLTPDDWEISVFDENLATVDYGCLPQPDLVGITAFTSQAGRAYEVAGDFRARCVPVVMGGIHATMCSQEALSRVDVVVMGEAESVWKQVLDDCRAGSMKRLYKGVRMELDKVPSARHDLLSHGYRFGSVQTSRGCPLACSFCSVTTFNGGRYRRRPVENVIRELRLIREKHVLIVDDNLIGTRKEHLEDTKRLLREIIAAKLRKKWVAQVTINLADDEELLALTKRAGCIGVFVGFESTSAEGLAEVHKKFIVRNGRDIRESVGRIQRHGIAVLGSFIVGLDIDCRGIGNHVAKTARAYGLDILNIMVLTPLPGTRLWNTMKEQSRIIADLFPGDWRYFTLTFPVAKYKNLSWKEIVVERENCYRTFYSFAGIVRRVVRCLWQRRNVWITLISNLVFRSNALRLDRQSYEGFDLARDNTRYCRNALKPGILLTLRTAEAKPCLMNTAREAVGVMENIDEQGVPLRRN